MTASSSSSTSTSALGPALTKPLDRDPHVLPSFTNDSIVNPEGCLLYLPPLLSSLPEKYSTLRSSSPVRGGQLPLTTNSRLPDIDHASLALHKALHHFRPIRSDYADSAYSQSFNWEELALPVDDEREWYCVVFRSKRKTGSNNEPLYDADRKAHEEAVQNGGLIAYWYGVPDPVSGLNLATCIWQSRKHAIAANSRPHHIEAMRLTAESYERYDLERHVLRKVKGETSPYVVAFTSGDVGW